MTDMDYNIDFVTYLLDREDNDFEKMKIMNAVNREVSGKVPYLLAHLVPILYSITFLSGFSVFIYKIII